jgi:hypothetical protein
MKKIYYLLALLPFAFTACQKQPNVLPGGYTKTLNLTLGASDYASLGSTVYASKIQNFHSDSDAKMYIPTILNNEYPQFGNGAKANIVFSEQPMLADSIYKDEQYTLVTTPVNDYKLLPGNNFSDFSIAQALSWLPYKFTAPSDPQLEILTFAWYNGQTTIPGSTFAFLYFNGSWKLAYLLSPAQYVAVGHPAYNQFTSADEANIPSYLNATLKADPSIMATAKVGSIQYVSFNFYNSAKATTQRVFAMVYNGTNWVKTATNSLAFLKSGGTWIPDPTVYYTLTTADTKFIAGLTTTGASSALLTNLGSYGDFETSWTSDELNIAFIAVLAKDFPAPKVNVNYVVTYLLYTNGADVNTTATFYYNGSAWVAGSVPQ